MVAKIIFCVGLMFVLFAQKAPVVTSSDIIDFTVLTVLGGIMITVTIDEVVNG